MASDFGYVMRAQQSSYYPIAKSFSHVYMFTNAILFVFSEEEELWISWCLP